LPGYSNFHYLISDINLDTVTSSWKVNGSAKNIGDNYLDYPKITVNFYNTNGAWLSAEDYNYQDVPSGHTWDFNIKYDGQFLNDVSYISFTVKANPFS